MIALEQSKECSKVLHDCIRTVKRMSRRYYMIALEQSKECSKRCYMIALEQSKECSEGIT